MPKRRPSSAPQRPATKADIDNAIDRFARITEKAFQKVVTKDDAKQFLTKEDAKQFLTKEDAKQFATKQDLKEMESRLAKKREQDKKEILDGIDTRLEVRDEEMQEKHEIELEQVAGKAGTPAPWKSIPRRLKAVETDVEKIKDQLEIA